MTGALPFVCAVALAVPQVAGAQGLKELLRSAVDTGAAVETRVSGELADLVEPRVGGALFARAERSGPLDENGCARYALRLRAESSGRRVTIAELSLDLCADLLPPAAGVDPGLAARLLRSR